VGAQLHLGKLAGTPLTQPYASGPKAAYRRLGKTTPVFLRSLGEAVSAAVLFSMLAQCAHPALFQPKFKINLLIK
jgi:hypothetical protein